VADGARSLREVHDALVQRGFARDWSASPRVVYLGRLDPSDLNLHASIEVSDFDFVRPPTIRLRDGESFARMRPHILMSDMSMCYFEPGAVVFDRYNPGGTVLQCLDRAGKVARDATRGRLDGDFSAEFQSYWGEAVVLTDLAAGGPGEPSVKYVAPARGGGVVPALCHDRSWLAALRARTSRSDPDEPCTIVDVGHGLSLDPAVPWPPTTLAALNRWLTAQAPQAVDAIETSFSRHPGISHWLALGASNGTFLAKATLPKQFQTPEFMTNRRKALPSLLRRVAAAVPILRANGQPADPGYVFARNMGGRRNLAGKKIALIGCGTIGGFLAHQLAQSGAGADGGRLLLVDNDKLGTCNLGRHLLGVPHLNRNKAEACRDHLLEHLPMLQVDAHDVDASSVDWTSPRFDLVVDATGEEGFSIALNERAVRARPGGPSVLFAWLLGNGAAAQSLLTGEPEFACFKCLKPILDGPPRFRTLKADSGVDIVRNAACGDALYVPFPVSRSAAAAALACEQALDWANGGPAPRFRSRLLDPDRALFVKDANPLRAAHCPACGADR